MKHYLLLFFTTLILFSNTFAQSTHYRLDSMVTDAFKMYYHYDSLNKLVGQEQSYYLQGGWTEGTYTYFSYDASNHLILEETKKYIDSTSSYVNDYKKEYSWENGKNTLEKTFNYVDDTYIRTDSILYNYNADILESDTTFNYDTSTNTWNYKYLKQYSYDTENNLIRKERSNYESYSWNELELQKYYYNSDGLIGKSRSNYDSMHEEWNVYDSISYDYSQSYIENEINYEYIDSTDSWKNDEKTTYHQDYSVSPGLILYPIPATADIEIGVFNYTTKIDSMHASNWDEASSSWNNYLTMNLYYTPFTGIADNEIIKVELFPNPASNSLIIRSKTKLENYQIFDIQGKFIKGARIESKEATINISGLRSGAYIIQAFDNNKNVLKRNFIKK